MWCAAAVQAEAEGDLRRWLGRVIWALSADSPYGTWLEQLSSASGSLLLDAIPVPPTSESYRGSASLTVPWMSEADWECLLRPMIRSVLYWNSVLFWMPIQMTSPRGAGTRRTSSGGTVSLVRSPGAHYVRTHYCYHHRYCCWCALCSHTSLSLSSLLLLVRACRTVPSPAHFRIQN